MIEQTCEICRRPITEWLLQITVEDRAGFAKRPLSAPIAALNCGSRRKKIRDLQIDPWMHEAVARVLTGKNEQIEPRRGVETGNGGRIDDRANGTRPMALRRSAPARRARRSYEPERPVIFRAASAPRACRISARWGRFCARRTCASAFELLEATVAYAVYAPSRLIVFIDDMDGLRKVPENIPNREATAALSGRAGLADPRSVRRCHREFRRTHDRAARRDFWRRSRSSTN